MKSVNELPIFVIGLLGIALAIWKSIAFLSARDPATGVPDLMAGVNHLWLAIAGLVVTIVCVVMYFVRHPRIQEEIHISR
jgi:ABC-type dipeptide/oligopeptide/nickel transport system permease component